MRCLTLSIATAACGCTSWLGVHDPTAAEHPDGRLGGPDSVIDARVDASIDAPIDSAPLTGSPLVLSEVVLAPTEGEMIEIFNTSNQTVDLSEFFLSDNGNYFRLPTGVPTIDSNDFIARFPAGASIPAHGTATIAISTAPNFTTSYGIAPTFSIADATMSIITAPGSPNLTSGGEVIVLFFWDGTTDLVSDADIVLAGSPSAANSLIAKSGVLQDGPDNDSQATAYAIDGTTITIQSGTPGSGLSTKRIALETGHETQTGTGNGLDGQDETTEVTAATWDSVTFEIPTPGSVPPALLQ